MAFKTKCQVCTGNAWWGRGSKDKGEQFCESEDCLQGRRWIEIGKMPKTQIIPHICDQKHCVECAKINYLYQKVWTS